MFIKVKCCKCNEMLYLYAKDENRRKATKTKKFVTGKACCGGIGLDCKS